MLQGRIAPMVERRPRSEVVLETREMAEGEGKELVRPSRKIGRYANVFQVGFNAFEVVIEFGEQFSDGEQARMHTRVVTNPVFARGLVDSLNDALADYASAYSTSPQG